LTKVVNDEKVWGWDDPRMPTIRGILRCGVTVLALREFIRMKGPSRNVLNLEWGALWALNKKYIDPQAPHHTAILENQAVPCRVHGFEGPNVVIKPKYVKNTELGSKKVIYGKTILLEQGDAQTLRPGEEITLMNWENAYVCSIDKDPNGMIITGMELELHLEGDVKIPQKISWLAAGSTNLIPVDLVDFSHLITKDKLEKDDQLEDFLSPVTEFRNCAFADCNMTELLKGAIIQFERKGYYKLDVPYEGNASRMAFFKIPSRKS
jgi:glutamyl-tRNA synthetase